MWLVTALLGISYKDFDYTAEESEFTIVSVSSKYNITLMGELLDGDLLSLDLRIDSRRYSPDCCSSIHSEYYFIISGNGNFLLNDWLETVFNIISLGKEFFDEWEKRKNREV